RVGVVAGEDDAVHAVEEVFPVAAARLAEDDGDDLGVGQRRGDAGGPQAAAVALARAAAIGAVDADAEGGGLNRHGGLLSSGAKWYAVMRSPSDTLLCRPRLGSIVIQPAGDASRKSAPYEKAKKGSWRSRQREVVAKRPKFLHHNGQVRLRNP